VTAAVAVALGTGLVLALSWRSLARPGVHGFYRFFAFESLLVLIVVNAGAWFVEPLAARQLVSWCLLAISAFLAVHGYRLLRVVGRPVRSEEGGTNLSFENTSVLVTAGAYRWIRHPMYASLLLLGCGAALKRLSAPSLALAACAALFLYATAKVEERENLERFGAAYREYAERNRMFVPYLF